ncbi:MAG: 30S ribosome-binding factor RbfA [Pseudomonadota bacterium]
MGRFENRSGPSQRQLRVGELVRHALADLFNRGEVMDEALDGGLTVLEVAMSPDLKIATAYVMPLAGERQEEALAALNKHRKFIRGQISRQLDLKYMPDLKFRLDTTLEYASHIDALLDNPKVRQDLDADAE